MREVREGLIQAYARSLGGSGESVTLDQINDRVASLKNRGCPTFVALDSSLAGNRKLAEVILERFPSVTLLLMAPTPADAKAIRYAEPLDPLPSPDIELRELSIYYDALARLS
jgi:hypothetical protein